MKPDIQALSVQITKFVDGRQPGWVECEFEDAEGRHHRIIDKVPVVSMEDLDANSSYPRAGIVQCEILNRWRNANGQELARISTATPWSIESADGLTEFVVPAAQLSP